MASNPFGGVQAAEMMGGMFGPNQYSQFQGRIPQPGYVGTPTDAMGNPIQQAPGMTLNSAPTAAPAAAAANPQQWALNNNMLNDMGRNLAMGQRGGMGLGDIVDQRAQNNAAYGMQQPYGGPVLQSSGPNAAQPPAGGGQGAAGGGSLDSALALLSNPGAVTTPGATVPQSQIGAGPSVLQQFLANRQGGTGAGNYSNTGFFDTLNRLRGQ